MKTKEIYAIWLSLVVGALIPATARAADAQPAPGTPAGPAVKQNAATPAVTSNAAPNAAEPQPQGAPVPAEAKAAAASAKPAEATAGTNAVAAPILANGEKGLRLNFRGVPLEMVLNYLSDAAGFVIVPKVDVKGKVDVWSNQPLSKDEAVNVLNSILNQNGYAAVRNGRTLTIMTQDEAKKQDIPVKVGSDPGSIPKSDEMVTQIVPVRYANATQLVKDLQPLLPSYALLTANESGNALVLTDTQSSIRRMVEIVKALDTSISTVSTVHVFPLQYADSKDVANEIKEVFASQQNANQGLPANFGRGAFFRMFRGGGGPGGPGGGGGGGTGETGGGGPTAKVVAVADERSNAVVVSAPADVMETIKSLVEQVDQPVADVTELRVFPLRHADPTEMADMFSQLFPDQTKNPANQNQGFRFGPFGPQANNAQSQSSERTKKLSQVTAVADARTSSLIVSAPSTLMPQIEKMVRQLDSDSTKKQQVFVYSLQNADVQEVQQVLQDMFQRSYTSMNRNSMNQTSPLTTRQQQNQQTLGTTLGNSRGGAGTGGLGTGGLGTSTLR